MPELTTTWLPELPNSNFLNVHNSQNSVKLINGQVHSEGEKDVENETNLKSNSNPNSISVSVQTEDLFEGFDFRPDLWYKRAYLWFHQQENQVLKVALIILVGLVITMFWYLRYQVSIITLLCNVMSILYNKAENLFVCLNAQISEIPSRI